MFPDTETAPIKDEPEETMKFTKGYWMNREGVEAADVMQIREARFEKGKAGAGDLLRLYCVNYGHDARAMGGPVLFLTVSSPGKDMIRLEEEGAEIRSESRPLPAGGDGGRGRHDHREKRGLLPRRHEKSRVLYLLL